MFEKQPDPQIAELITILKALLKKLEAQDVKLETIARFVRENSSSTAAFATVRR
jgi:hypothetical protein